MSGTMALQLASRSTLLYVLVFWRAAAQTTLKQPGVYGDISPDMSKTITMSSSAGCQSSSIQVCVSLKSNDQDHTLLQDSLSSTNHPYPDYSVTPLYRPSDSYNSTLVYITPSESESIRLYNYMTKVNWYFTVVVYPSIGVLGLVSNLFSGIILVQSGLGKPSNIFLLGMTLADSLCLLGAVNIPFILKHVPKIFPFGTYLWEYSRSASFACYIFGVACRCLSAYGIYVSAALCTVVTIERLLAVYLPLQFISILTPTRAWLVCCGCFFIWLPYLVFMGIKWYVFDYMFYWPNNTFGGEMAFVASQIVVILDFYVASVFGKFIPLTIVIVGSICIAIKVIITLRKRRKMVAATAKTTSSGSRTTTTLLTVCLTFSVTKIITLPTYSYIPVPEIHSILFWNYYGAAINIAEYVNGFCNFFIYVFLNRKFRIVFLNLFSRKKR